MIRPWIRTRYPCGCSAGRQAIRVTRCPEHAGVHARQLVLWRAATFAHRLAAAGELASA